MRSGWLGGIAAALMTVALALGVEGAVRVNGQAVSVEPPVRLSGDSVLVPILSFSPLLGIEAVDRDGRVTLRWSGGWNELPSASTQRISGTAYTRIDELADRVAGIVHREGNDVDVLVPQARLLEISLAGDELVMRFDRFTPMALESWTGGQVLRFRNCRFEAAGKELAFGPEGVGRASLVEVDASTYELRIAFLEEAALAMRCLEADGAYSLFLIPAEIPSVQSTLLLGSGLTFVEWRTSVGEKAIEAAYVRVDNWRARADVRPLLPPGGAGTQGPIEELMAEGRAAVALSSRSGRDPGLVVIDGVPYSMGQGAPFALSIDAFGSLGAFAPEVCAYASTSSGRLALDGVDRPVGYDELVAYPPGYGGDITRGFPEGFSVVRVRDGVVVSILEASFVVADSSATLLVASGVARARLAGVALGDRVDLVCEVGPDRRFVRHALSVDRVLLWSGQVQSAGEASAASWSVAGTDWQGGFFFMAVTGDGALDAGEVLSLVSLVPVPPSRAVVLERDGAAALALDVGSYSIRRGARTPVAVSLGAVLP